MRARTRRLRSLFSVIVNVSPGCTTAHSPAAFRDERKGLTILIRESAPLCLSRTPAEEESRGWAGIGGHRKNAKFSFGRQDRAEGEVRIQHSAFDSCMLSGTARGPNGFQLDRVDNSDSIRIDIRPRRRAARLESVEITSR